MKLLFILLFGLVNSFSIHPKKKRQQVFPFGTWMHSHEEDKDPNSEWKVYRPASFPFPPSRGRSGFIVQKDGKFALLGPSPSDRSDTVWGTWKKEGACLLSFQIAGTELKQLSWKRDGKKRLLIELK
jgi:hypothetical protein